MATDNITSSNVKEGNVEAEIVRGDQDDVLEDHSISAKTKVEGKRRRNVLASKIVKRDVSQIAPKYTSARITELARPKKRHVLMTLHAKGSILSPMLLDNLIKLIEVESCLTPEEAAQVLRRRKRKSKTIRLSPVSKKWEQKIAKVDTLETTMLDRDATICQYLIAECFVKSILAYQCQSQKKEIRDIAQVILKRLTSLSGYMDTQSDDRATQQLRLLADIVACWIAEVLTEVAETRKEALEEYCKKRQMKMMEVDDDDDDDDDDQTSSKAEDQEQTKQKTNSDKTASEENNEKKRENKEIEDKETYETAATTDTDTEKAEETEKAEQ